MPLYNPPSPGGAMISEVSADPTVPAVGSEWVLFTQRKGIPIGLLLSLTYAQDIYQLSYATNESTIIRTNLS